MALFPVLSFVFLLLFGSVGSWASCVRYSQEFDFSTSGSACMKDDGCGAVLCSWGAYARSLCSSYSCETYSSSGYYYTDGTVIGVDGGVTGGSVYYYNCSVGGGECAMASYNVYRYRCRYAIRCNTKCEADSLACLKDPNATWDPQSCKCGGPMGPPPDSSFVCQNAGGPEPGGFGGPRVAKLFKCDENQVCTNTADLAGTCQDWGFCSEGVDHCYIHPDSTGDPPCGRAGSGLTSTTSCYYACADGKNLRCKPVSTQYVAGAIYVGECPSSPPAGCYPHSSSSGGGGSSSSGGGGSSSSSSGGSYSSSNGYVPPDTVVIPQGSQIDYTRILNAIKDTLHRANNQRDFIADLQVTANNSFSTIANYSQYAYSELDGINGKMTDVVAATSSTSAAADGINSTLTSLQENGIKISGPVASSVVNTSELLDELTKYLKGDSLVVNVHQDSIYNPILRDIKAAIDSLRSRDSSVFVRDTAFAKWFANYASDTAQRNGVLGDIYRNTALMAGDSVKNGLCSRFMRCYTPTPTFANAQACAASVGVSLDQCLDGGSPFDSHLNVGVGILRTIWDAIFGDDTTEVTYEPIDSAVSFSPAMSQAFDDLSSANVSVNLDSLKRTIDDVKARLDSARVRKNDSVTIQPDSLWLDSSDAAKYVQTLLLPSGTGTDCFICHADLGNFGGLSRQNLSIHIDFSNFGGYNFCEIIRVVIRIATLVTCISLTLGSWAAAFGYNPKNDA